MDWLKSLYPDVQKIVENALPEYWPELKHALTGFLANPIPETYLPLACCRAVGGEARNAVHVAAALLANIVCLRIFDDAADQDRPGRLWEQVGPSRAWNYGSAIQVLSFDILGRAPLPPQLIYQLHRLFIDTLVLIAYGQDRDMSGQTRSIEAYWLTIEHKNAHAFAGACAAGAIVGTDNIELVKACGRYGHHLGLAIQILNDMDSIWSAEGKTDLKQGKVTLPLLYGLATEHPERDELNALVAADDIASNGERIKEILDHIDTRGYLMWAALTERDHALEAIAPCPNLDGREVLESYITAMFDDVDEILSAEGSGRE
jgi:geranylgeranyl diphosphate synthase type I